jgi:hypothetical protein
MPAPHLSFVNELDKGFGGLLWRFNVQDVTMAAASWQLFLIQVGFFFYIILTKSHGSDLFVASLPR